MRYTQIYVMTYLIIIVFSILPCANIDISCMLLLDTYFLLVTCVQFSIAHKIEEAATLT